MLLSRNSGCKDKFYFDYESFLLIFLMHTSHLSLIFLTNIASDIGTGWPAVAQAPIVNG